MLEGLSSLLLFIISLQLLKMLSKMATLVLRMESASTTDRQCELFLPINTHNLCCTILQLQCSDLLELPRVWGCFHLIIFKAFCIE